MRPLTLLLVLVAAYLLYRWYRQGRLRGLLHAAAPVAVGAAAPTVAQTVGGPSAITAPVVPAATRDVTVPAPSITVVNPGTDLYWRVPDSYIELR